MAIDLPPVIPPQLSTAERIEAHAKARGEIIETKVGEFTLKVSGNRYLTTEQVEQIAAASKTPSQAIRALNQAYYQTGHLLVAVYYAQRGSTIFAHVINGKLVSVEAPDTVKSHFSPLIGDEDLTVAEYERRRVLADLQAQRMGQNYVISYNSKNNPEHMTLVFKGKEKEDYSATEPYIALGNQGNRFVGRYFATAGIDHTFWNGTDLNLEYQNGLTEWGENNGGGNYHGLSLNLGKPLRWGLYGVELSAVEYERDAFETSAAEPDTSIFCTLLGLCSDTPASQNPVVIEGEIYSAALTGEQVLYANPRQRLTVSERLDYVESKITLDDGRILQDEAHAGIELGLKYFNQSEWFGAPVRWSAQAFVENGLAGESGTFGTDDLADSVSAGKRSSEYLIYKPRLGLKVRVSDDYSFDVDVLSQLSDGKQLPQQKQFVLGGVSTLSAYLPGTLIGDTGIYARIKLERVSWDLFGFDLTPSLFVEYGEATYENVRGLFGETRSITDAGFRVAGDLGWGLSMELVAATPVSKSSNLNDEALENLEADFFWKLRKTF